MATRNLCAVAPAPRTPAEDVDGLPEGGAAAARAAVERLFPGRYAPVDGPHGDVCVWVGTYGETVLVVGDAVGAGEARVPEGWGVYRYGFQTVALAASFEVEVAGRRRLVALSPESVDHEEGASLPFEAAFRGAVGVVDADGLCVAAQQWMFGARADAPDPAAWAGPVAPHAFRPAGAVAGAGGSGTEAAVPARNGNQPGRAGRPGRFSRFRRRLGYGS
ncbi:hypothetical protein [Streptomyces cavernicola]|uniref:YokE-like PH domain-containing protein n=1 Tax=Streptomyces cavernicola TaxID=3043613 RepID=A0ABT6S921_9ACTN|nr:hypothetical protein [Streptomyces sp. B-S-A6]MDI3404594.1 hypothetical protein [Streptomyces sp. B-S-A6]